MSGITKNAIRTMLTQPSKPGNAITVQVMDIKLIVSSKYRIIISDSEFFEQSLVGQQSHHFFQNGMVQNHQLIKIKKYSVAEMNNGSILTLDEIEPSTCMKSLIGAPSKFENKPSRYEIKPVLKRSDENNEFTSVKTLTSSTTNFTIKARVTKKYPIREWKNERGAGKLFNINIIDSYNDEISVTFFKEDADKFYDIIREGKVYIFKNGQVKLSNKRFQTVDNEYTITVDKKTEIVETNDQSEILAIKCNPVGIDSIPNLQPGSLIDVCVGVIEVCDANEVIAKKSGNIQTKRVLKLIDQSNTSIELTLWNEEALNPALDNLRIPFVLLAKSLKISDFNGISLTSDRCTQIMYNPDLPPAKQLKTWLAKQPKNLEFINLSIRGSLGSEKPFKNFSEIKQESECSEREESYTISGLIGFIKHEPEGLFYSACKNVKKCKKKVIRDSSGMYRCEVCAESFEECEFKYLINIRLQDYSDAIWVTVFDDAAKMILEISANELHEMYIGNQELFDETLQKVYMKRVDGVLKVKMSDTPNGRKPKYILNTFHQFDAQKSVKQNLELINQLLVC